MFNQTLEDIRAARQLIANPENWTQNNFALNKQGVPVGTEEPIACAFCSDGAIMRAVLTTTDMKFNREYLVRTERAYEELSVGTPHGLISFNDDNNHEAVIAHFDKTITRLLAA